ncbi:nickel-dependent lactate racemase [Clostridium sp. BSD9I1]|uniref:nickel-dependent lactate racemase n=1 Tax=Clostridium sp. BSD9I1 TaxID=2003589 RepID=UPI001A9A6DBC|nr:nickel-dependent lactate racemase [Clostridium sp. BSD9I1]
MNESLKIIKVPYGDKEMQASIPASSLLFAGEMTKFSPIEDFEKTLLDKLENPIGCEALKNQVKKDDKILILIDDNTRVTPVNKILPVLIKYLTNDVGIPLENIEILTAPGTHRVMTKDEIIEKVGEEIFKTVKISQHDFTDKDALIDMGTIEADGMKFPIHVNKKVQEVHYIIGLGNIIPHSDAGYSGGGKIVQPGICGSATTSATHVAGALMERIPLGNIEDNPCRKGIEEVARIVGLKFIINVVMTPDGEVTGIFAGDFIKAHREGAKLAAKVYGVEIPELADIVVVSSSPCDIDYWQAEKGLISAYFSVKKDGYIIFVAPCYEGLVHNHPKLIEWAKASYEESKNIVGKISLDDDEADLVAADIAMGNARVRERAKILIVTEGLDDKEISILGYKKNETLQEAVDYALKEIPGGKVGVLPRGGDCLPMIISATHMASCK